MVLWSTINRCYVITGSGCPWFTNSWWLGYRIALFFQSCPGICCWPSLVMEYWVLWSDPALMRAGPRVLRPVVLLVPGLRASTYRLLAEETTPGPCLISAWPQEDNSRSAVPWGLNHVLDLTARAVRAVCFLVVSRMRHFLGDAQQSWWRAWHIVAHSLTSTAITLWTRARIAEWSCLLPCSTSACYLVTSLMKGQAQ